MNWREATPADFAVIGDPVAHSKSPRMHAAAYQALGISLEYVALQVDRDEVASALDYLAAQGYRGVNVTVPHKEAAFDWAAKPDQLARRIGAVNTIDFRDGSATNTDATGFAATIRKVDFEGNRALILGAGGSARAVAVALVDEGWEVAIWNRTPSKPKALAVEFGLTALPDIELDYDLVVNATSVGLGADSLPIDWTRAQARTLAYDLVYGTTPFLQSAAEAGLRVVDGRDLLAAQGALALQWWLGVEPPFQVMREAID